MRVLLSSFQCWPNRGSELGNGWHWARALADCGHDVTVLTSSEYRDVIYAEDPKRVAFRFIDVPASALAPLSPRFGTFDSYLRWQDAALRLVEKESRQYDLTHHVAWGSLHLGSMLWRLPAPLVYGPIGGGQIAPANYWRYFGRDWPAEAVRTAFAKPLLKLNSRSRRTIRNSAVILATNSETAAACQRLGATDVRYMLADGLPAEWLGSARSRPTGIPVVLWVGRLQSHKAPALALRAFAELRRSMPARLIVAGDGPRYGQMRALVKQFGLAEDVELLGRVSWDGIRCLYDSASVFLFTSLRESSGTPFLEALGRGLPAVALDHQGIADADCGPAALKVALTPRPRDLPGQLASALQTILCDDEWEVRSEAAVKWAGEWVWSVKALAASQIYREVLR